MPLPKECDRCHRKFLPRSSICTKCDKCLEDIRKLNGKMRNEIFKKTFQLNLRYRRI
jgi:uncharacterized OB-fold protein